MTGTTRTASTTPNVDPFYDTWMGDYCPACCPPGDQADRCTRLAAMTEPDAVIWTGGKRLICEYHCDRCGHDWQRPDLWDAASAGFDSSARRSVA